MCRYIREWVVWLYVHFSRFHPLTCVKVAFLHSWIWRQNLGANLTVKPIWDVALSATKPRIKLLVSKKQLHPSHWWKLIANKLLFCLMLFDFAVGWGASLDGTSKGGGWRVSKSLRTLVIECTFCSYVKTVYCKTKGGRPWMYNSRVHTTTRHERTTAAQQNAKS